MQYTIGLQSIDSLCLQDKLPDTARPSSPEKKGSLLGAVATFVYLVAVSLIILVVWSVWQTRVQTLAQSKSATANMARAMAQQANDTMHATDNILVGIVQLVEKNTTPLARTTLRNFLRDNISNQPMLSGLSVYDAQGQIIATSRPRAPSHATVADRAYFQFHANSPQRDAHVGQPIISRITNEWVLTVSRRINHSDGTFAGIVLASVRVDYFNEYYKEFDIGNLGSIFLATDTGTLLVRRAQKEFMIGTDLSGGPLFQEYRANGPQGTIMLVASLDDTERLYSYRHIEKYALLVAVALAKEDILATWQAQTYRLISITSVLLLLLGMLGFRIIYLINAKDDIEYQLREASDTLEKLNDELRMLASVDALTGLPNRRQFDITLETEFNRALRNQTSIALVMLDVDRFKQYNDLYGHPAGDTCLRQIGQTLLDHGPQRATDLPARYGGEEMVLLLPDTDLQGATAIAEKVRLAIRALAISQRSSPDGIVTISAGVAAFVPTRNQDTSAQLLQAADLALYAAKAGGRDRVCQQDL